MPTAVTLSASAATVMSGSRVTLTAQLWEAFGGEPDDTYPLDGYDVEFIDTVGEASSTLGVATIDYETGRAVLAARLSGPGPHTLVGRFAGDEDYSPSESEPVAITVTPDTAVSAAGVGVSTSTFYPYKDGYRDTVAIRGTPDEPVTVAIRVYNSSGKAVRSWSIASRSTAWAVAWNGRTASGSLVAAGKYRVVQTLRDGLGNARTFTAYTTISRKRLYWYTGTVTRYANQFSGSYTSDFGWVLPSNRYYRGVNLYGNIQDEWAYVGYSFTLPSAATYGTVTFKVIGAPYSGRGVPYISLWNYATHDEDAIRWVGRSYAWYGTSGSGAGHVSSRHVRAFVTVVGSNWGWYDVAKVRLTYRYGILK